MLKTNGSNITKTPTEIVLVRNDTSYYLNRNTKVRHIINKDKEFLIVESINTKAVSDVYDLFLNKQNGFGIFLHNLSYELESGTQKVSDEVMYLHGDLINMMSVDVIHEVSNIRLVFKISRREV